jgi:MHS family dicarboxylic acid transporter PcaT-like MFS transporter/MHS family alpha-ketoglutarate permease-like MFS transporter
MIWFGALATLSTVPILHALAHITNPYAAFGLVLLSMAVISLYTSIGGLIKAEMFPLEVRALAVGLSYALANAIFGGSAEFVALELKSRGMESTFYWYVTTMCAIALIVAIRMKDPSKEGYLRDEP